MKFKRWVWLIILIVIAFGSLKFYRDFLLSPLNSNDSKERIFIVYQGESASDIGKRLEKEGFIRSSKAFSILLRNYNQANNIKTGDFKLSPSMSSEEVLKELASGQVDKWVTLLEGWRIEEMAAKLNKELGIDEKEFIKQADEGYMFPDTYLFNPRVTVPDIVSTLKNNFNRKYDVSITQKINKLGLTSDQGVILASIVEREARSDEARTMVASILLKRYKINMGLNVDASIQYAIGLQNGAWWKRNLSKPDLKIDSPYNTYIHAGLPPGPISNPSLSSLKAVSNADPSTSYLYYYHDSQGISHYGKTLDEHNANIAKYP